MAVRTNTSSKFSNSSWMADAFLNISLPNQSGGFTKIGAISLKNDKGHQADLIKLLTNDPNKVALIKDKLIISFNLATPAAGTSFKLD